MEYNSKCTACGSSECEDLPVPHPSRSVISDGSVVSTPLRRRTCNNCGHGFHALDLGEEQVRAIYGSDYSIGLRDATAEVARSIEYGRQIKTFLAHHLGSEADLSKIVEFGCGSGTLLNHLHHRLGSQVATGVEPSSRVVSYARSIADRGVSIHQGFAENFDENPHTYDLCLSVNVIEHTHDPRGFLQACKRTVSETGSIVVVCPDGDVVGSELLFYDHVSSFTSASLAKIMASVDLRIVGSAHLTGSLQGFGIHLAKLGNGDLENRSRNNGLPTKERAKYLNTWSRIENSTYRLLRNRKYGIFGTGEYCDLLYAYSPSVVENADFFVRDQPIETELHNKPVLSTNDFLNLPQIPLVAAVHERGWSPVCERFRSKGILIFHPFEVANQDTIT